MTKNNICQNTKNKWAACMSGLKLLNMKNVFEGFFLNATTSLGHAKYTMLW